MQLTHKIALNSTLEQISYFKRAAGTARFVWNWALGEWNRQYGLGQKPKAMALKKQFNQIKYQQYPWLTEVHRDSHAQPFTYLGKAWQRFFSELKNKQSAHEPRFKKKGKSRDSFYVANDKFRFEEGFVYLPKIGKVALCESLRFEGKILGATVSRTADRWFIAVQVEVPEHKALKKRTGNEIVGVDLGITTAVTLSTGQKIDSPKPLKQALRRLRIRSCRISRKIEMAKAQTPKGARLSLSQNRQKSSQALAKLHARIVNIRTDFTHKLTTQLCRENQAIGIEDLNVKGMLSNHKLARSLSDIGFGEFRRQLEYKVKRYGVHLVIADQWYPSTRLCSVCYTKNEALTLKDRQWQCSCCHTEHDRDLNASYNLERLATITALPVANRPVTEDAVLGKNPYTGGKVTLVSYECGQ